MPDDRLQRTREGQPEVPPCVRLGHFTFYQAHTAPDHWRAPHDNAAEQIAREAARRSLDERFPDGYRFKNDDEVREACRLDGIANGGVA